MTTKWLLKQWLLKMNELEMAIHHQINGPKPPYHVLHLKVPIQNIHRNTNLMSTRISTHTTLHTSTHTLKHKIMHIIFRQRRSDKMLKWRIWNITWQMLTPQYKVLQLWTDHLKQKILVASSSLLAMDSCVTHFLSRKYRIYLRHNLNQF